MTATTTVVCTRCNAAFNVYSGQHDVNALSCAECGALDTVREAHDDMCTMCETEQRDVARDDDMCVACRAAFRAQYVEDITREYTSHVRDMLHMDDVVASDVRMIGTRQATFTVTCEGETFMFNVTNTSTS